MSKERRLRGCEGMEVQMGDYLILVQTGDGWKIQRVPDDTVAALQLAGGKGQLQRTLEQYHKEFEAGWDDEYRPGESDER